MSKQQELEKAVYDVLQHCIYNNTEALHNALQKMSQNELAYISQAVFICFVEPNAEDKLH